MIESTVAAAPSAQVSLRQRRRRGRRIRRAVAALHRWPSLVLGLLLVVETTSGAVLLYQHDYIRATHSGLYHHTSSAHPLGPDAAIAVVKAADPAFAPSWADRTNGIWAVGNAGYTTIYAVDPGTGTINGRAGTDGGVMGFLVNLHDCALSCEGYPGHVAWLGEPVPTLGLSWLAGVTWSAVILGTLGVLLILLTGSGLVAWWPGRKRLSHGFRVRLGKGRFARDHDLHNVIGLLALPFLLLWGVTGAAFEFPVVEKAWLAVTGGDQQPEVDFSLTANPHAPDAPMLTTAEATDVAVSRVPGDPTFIGLPYEGADYFEIDIVSGYGSYAHRGLYTGDTYVLVDAYDASHVKVVDKGTGPLSNRLYDKVFEPAHFGAIVNGWWRLVWLVMGLAPLALMVTGVSTWLVRPRSRRRRRDRRRAASMTP